MVLNRTNSLKWMAPLVASAALIFGFGARAADLSGAVVAVVPPVHLNSSPTAGESASNDDGMNWCRVHTEHGVHIRATPNTQHLPVGVANNGDMIRARATSNAQWLEMEWPKNMPAWISREAVQLSPDNQTATIRIQKARILSEGSNVKGSEVASVERGTTLKVISESNGWLKVQAPASAHAYISAQYVTVGVKPIEENDAPAARPIEVSRKAIESDAETIALPVRAHADADVVVVQQLPRFPSSTVNPSGDPLRASIEDTRRKLSLPDAPRASAALNSAAVANLFTPSAPAQAKTVDDAEVVRITSEKKRADEVDTARLAAEKKRVEDEHLAAEKKRLDDERIAQAAAAKRKAELEVLRSGHRRKRSARPTPEAERLAAEKKKNEDAEIVRLVMAQKKIDDAEAARKSAEARKLEIEGQAQTAAALKKELEEKIDKLSAAHKVAEAEETARLSAEKKRLDDVETARKSAAGEQTRLTGELKRLEDEIKNLASTETKKRQELESQTQTAAARKQQLETEIAQLASARKKAEGDEKARKVAEQKRLDEAEKVRVAAESKRLELEQQATAAAAKKEKLEQEIQQLAEAKLKEEKAHEARIALAKKLTEDAETARKAIDAKRKVDEAEQAKLAADRKKAEDAEKARVVAAAKQQAELDEQTRLAVARKTALEAEIARLYEAKRKAEEDALVRAASEKKRVEEATAAITVVESKRKTEEAALAKTAAERKKQQDEDLARLAEQRTLFDVAEKARISAESLRKTEESRAAAERKRAEEAEGAAKLAAEKRRVEESEAAKALAIKQQAETDARAAAEKKKLAEDEAAAKLALVQKTARENDAAIGVKDAEHEFLKSQSGRLPEPGAENNEPVKAVGKLTLKTSSPVLVDEYDLNASGREAPTEANYNAEYVPQYIRDIQKKFVMPPASNSVRNEPERAALLPDNEAPKPAAKLPPPAQAETVAVVAAPRAVQPPPPPPPEPEPRFKPIPMGQRRLVTEVGLLYRTSIPDVPGVKYDLRNSGVILHYIVEPSDVDLSPMVGRPISLSGYTLGRTQGGTSVLQMRNASTFG